MSQAGMNHEQFVDALKRNGMTLNAHHCAVDDSCGFQGWPGLGSYETRLQAAVRARDEWKSLMERKA